MDSVEARWGSSADLSIIHDGTNNMISGMTGPFYITQYADDQDLIFRSDDQSGGVKPYFFLDGSDNEVLFEVDTLHLDNVKV